MKTIFVSTDFSDAGNNAVKYAVSFAHSINASLIAFHSGSVPKFNPTISEAKFLELENKEEIKNRDKIEQLLEKYCEAEHIEWDQQKFIAVAQTGILSVDTILAVAHEYGADLLIVGTHGKTGLKLFGSTTSGIVLQAEIPVLAVPTNHGFKHVKTIVYASDLRNLENELKIVVPAAKAFNATIEILYLDFGWGLGKPPESLNDLKKEVGYDKIRIVVQKEKGGFTILQQIENYLKVTNPDMLVMFPEDRSYFDRLFGIGKTEELTYRTRLPLFTFRKSKVTT